MNEQLPPGLRAKSATALTVPVTRTVISSVVRARVFVPGTATNTMVPLSVLVPLVAAAAAWRAQRR